MNLATTPSFRVTLRWQRFDRRGLGCPLFAQRQSHAPRRLSQHAEARGTIFNWLSATGTGCFFAAIVSGLLLGRGRCSDEDFLANAVRIGSL